MTNENIYLKTVTYLINVNTKPVHDDRFMFFSLH